MEDTLREYVEDQTLLQSTVLILVLMEDTLRVMILNTLAFSVVS